MSQPDDKPDPDHLQASAARDQLWASLRALRPEIDLLSAGHFDGSARQAELVKLVARIVSAELGFRDEEADTSGVDCTG